MIRDRSSAQKRRFTLREEPFFIDLSSARPKKRLPEMEEQMRGLTRVVGAAVFAGDLEFVAILLAGDDFVEVRADALAAVDAAEDPLGGAGGGRMSHLAGRFQGQFVGSRR
jgi:hypothetical protein